MKNNQKGSIPVIIAVIFLIVVVGFFLAKKAGYISENTPIARDAGVADSYKVLKDESLWRVKYINNSTPMQWDITEKGILLKEVQQNKFICGEKEAQFVKYSSFNNDSIGGWDNISVVDCLDYYFYFVYEFGDAGPKLYGPFNKESK